MDISNWICMLTSHPLLQNILLGSLRLNFKLLCRIEEEAASVSDVQAINSQSVTCIIDVRTRRENLLAYLLMLLVAVT